MSGRRRSDNEGSIYRRGSDGLWVAALTYTDDKGKRRQRVIASANAAALCATNSRKRSNG